jgi:hypothetical protein
MAFNLLKRNGAGDRVRTGDVQLGKNDRRLKIQDNGVYGGSSRYKEISNFPNSAIKPPLK